MWKNIVQPDMLQMTIWPMGIEFLKTRATNIHSEYVLLLFRGRNGYASGPQCYVIHTLHLLLNIRSVPRSKHGVSYNNHQFNAVQGNKLFVLRSLKNTHVHVRAKHKTGQAMYV